METVWRSGSEQGETLPAVTTRGRVRYGPVLVALSRLPTVRTRQPRRLGDIQDSSGRDRPRHLLLRTDQVDRPTIAHGARRTLGRRGVLGALINLPMWRPLLPRVARGHSALPPLFARLGTRARQGCARLWWAMLVVRGQYGRSNGTRVVRDLVEIRSGGPAVAIERAVGVAVVCL